VKVSDERKKDLLWEEDEDITRAFCDATKEQARRLKRGLMPFCRAGNWIDTLCARLEGIAEEEDWTGWNPHEIFAEGWYGSTQIR